jgi:transposase
MARNTVGRQGEAAAVRKPVPKRAEKLDRFKAYIVDRMKAAAPDRIPAVVLFREIKARQLPGGSWERVYAFADGSAQVNGSPDGDFSAFEQEHMAKPLTAK